MTTTHPKLTLAQAKFLVDQADRLFERAAKAWENGNNSGDNAKLARGDRLCDKYREEAEKLLRPLGIVVGYPGLYPSFTVRGIGYHDTLSAVSAAMEEAKP